MKKRWIGRAGAALIGLALIAGCAENAPTAPEKNESPPVLPDAASLDFETGFFDGGAKALNGSHQNFLNAAIRVVALHAFTEIALAPPVAALALAVHTFPSRQPDGAYLWVYTHVMADEDVQIRLRGKDEGDHATWEMRVTALHLDPPVDRELWFEGETSPGGHSGVFRFYDWNLAGKPKMVTLEWENDADFEELRVTDHMENPGDELSYIRYDADCRIDYHEDAAGADWFIRWNEADGTGSLLVEDYNGGEEACWDENREDISCAPAP
ncbi:MAG: hypothetical protein JW958_00215 [Candidatus Eisenbacteria bacterium]|nr:hypothetical protein [Candidatus Eisenbacteria bacterium]